MGPNWKSFFAPRISSTPETISSTIMPTNPSIPRNLPKASARRPASATPAATPPHIRLVEDAGGNDLGGHGIAYFGGETLRLPGTPREGKTGNVKSRQGEESQGIGFEEPIRLAGHHR